MSLRHHVTTPSRHYAISLHHRVNTSSRCYTFMSLRLHVTMPWRNLVITVLRHHINMQYAINSPSKIRQHPLNLQQLSSIFNTCCHHKFSHPYRCHEICHCFPKASMLHQSYLIIIWSWERIIELVNSSRRSFLIGLPRGLFRHEICHHAFIYRPVNLG